jgi:hypothetical protein
MVETRIVLVCSECGAFWDPAADADVCTDSRHNHHRYESHLHRTRVVLPDGTELTGASFGSADPYARDVCPDFGLYLDNRWRPPWPHDHLDWPDFGVPDDPALVATALESLLGRVRTGQRVEIGCYGGHGRTGTALACLAVLCGQVPSQAVSWVRAGYCGLAVETDEQEAFVLNFTSQSMS